MATVQPLVAPGGRFAQDRFLIVTDQATVTVLPTSGWTSDQSRNAGSAT